MKTSLFSAMISTGTCLLLAPVFGQSKAHSRTAHPEAVSVRSSRVSGTYTRIKHRRDENQSGVLEVRQLNGGKIHFHLTALWWSAAQSDLPHNGDIEATVTLRNGAAAYRNENYRLTMRFANHTVTLTESGSNPEFGVNVSAAGTYRLTSKDRTH